MVFPNSSITMIGNSNILITTSNGNTNTNTMVAVSSNPNTNTISVDAYGNTVVVTSNTTQRRRTPYPRWGNQTTVTTNNIHQQIPRRGQRVQKTSAKRESPFNDDRDEKKKMKKTVIGSSSRRGGVKTEEQGGGSGNIHVKPEKKEDSAGVNLNCPIPTPNSNCLCSICFDYKKDSEMFRGSNCKHLFCADCISKHVAAEIQNCSVLLADEGGEVVTSAECPSCHRMLCEFQKLVKREESENDSFQKPVKREEYENDSDRKFVDLTKGDIWEGFDDMLEGLESWTDML